MKNKFLLILWVILLIGIFTLLSLLGFSHKNKVSTYHKYEDKLIEAARAYTKNHNTYPKKGTRLEIKVDDLIKEGFVNKKDAVRGCSGSVIVKYDRFIDYLPNIKCKYYKTNNK